MLVANYLDCEHTGLVSREYLHMGFCRVSGRLISHQSMDMRNVFAACLFDLMVMGHW